MSQVAEMPDRTHEQVISEAKGEFNRAKDRLLKDLATTPDDKLNWSPSPSSRTPIQQIAHSAMAISGMMGMFEGEPIPFENIAEADAGWRKAEKEFKTREEVTSLLNKNCDEYCSWLDSLPASKLNSTLKVPFGEFPMASIITWPADHLRNHAAQMEYMQTIYGDMDWHM